MNLPSVTSTRQTHIRTQIDTDQTEEEVLRSDPCLPVTILWARLLNLLRLLDVVLGAFLSVLCSVVVQTQITQRPSQTLSRSQAAKNVVPRDIGKPRTQILSKSRSCDVITKGQIRIS
jgi:hypothetical protein